MKTIQLRASELCYRRAWLDAKFDNVFLDEHDSRSRLRLALGTKMQATIIEEVAQLGYLITEHEQDVELVAETDTGVMTGHPDALAMSDEDELPLIGEIKTTSASRFAQFRSEVARKISNGVRGGYLRQLKRYIALATVNASRLVPYVEGWFSRRRVNPCTGLLAVMNRDDCDLVVVREDVFMPWDDHQAFIESELEFAKSAAEPGIPKGFSRYAPPCTGCRYFVRCWNEPATAEDVSTAALAADLRVADNYEVKAKGIQAKVRERVMQVLEQRGSKSLMLGDEYRAFVTTPKRSRLADWKAMESDGVADQYAKLGAEPKPRLTIKAVTPKESSHD